MALTLYFFQIFVVLPVIFVFIISALREIYFMVRYRNEFIECLNFIRLNKQDLDVMFSLNRGHRHYIVRHDFIMKADGKQLRDCRYDYYLSNRPRRR